MPRGAATTRAVTRWTVRIIPIFILCAFIVVTYAIVGHISVEYYIQEKNNVALGAVFIALYFILFFLMIVTYLRTFITVQTNPGFVPLRGDEPDVNSEKKKQPSRQRSRQQRRRSGGRIAADPDRWAPVDTDPDSPGLETFYSKDIFECEVDGRPRWCSSCRQWKPDRAHHSSELGRCVRKMDHLCPWVGGMVSETSFNFFTQFCFYCAGFCGLCLAIAAYTIVQQSNEREIPDGWVIALIAAPAFFLLFTGGMVLTSLRYIFTNITNIDILSRSRVSYIAVRIPSDTPPSHRYPTIVYPLQPAPPPPQGQQQWQYPQYSNSQLDGALPPPPPPAAVAPPTRAPTERDAQAVRKFAILQFKSSDNPWSLGMARNWKSVMGNGPLEWFLPIRHSPCCDHDSMNSDYPTGRALTKLKKRFGLPGYEADAEAIEAWEQRGQRGRRQQTGTVSTL